MDQRNIGFSTQSPGGATYMSASETWFCHISETNGHTNLIISTDTTYGTVKNQLQFRLQLAPPTCQKPVFACFCHVSETNKTKDLRFGTDTAYLEMPTSQGLCFGAHFLFVCQMIYNVPGSQSRQALSFIKSWLDC